MLVCVLIVLSLIAKSKMTVQVSKRAEEKTKVPPKLLWPGHLEEGKDGKVIEELEKEDIKPFDDSSKRYCKVSKYLYD